MNDKVFTVHVTVNIAVQHECARWYAAGATFLKIHFALRHVKAVLGIIHKPCPALQRNRSSVEPATTFAAPDAAVPNGIRLSVNAAHGLEVFERLLKKSHILCATRLENDHIKLGEYNTIL